MLFARKVDFIPNDLSYLACFDDLGMRLKNQLFSQKTPLNIKTVMYLFIPAEPHLQTYHPNYINDGNDDKAWWT